MMKTVLLAGAALMLATGMALAQTSTGSSGTTSQDPTLPHTGNAGRMGSAPTTGAAGTMGSTSHGGATTQSPTGAMPEGGGGSGAGTPSGAGSGSSSSSGR